MRTIRRIYARYFILVCVLIFSGCSRIHADKVLATVNGEPIREKDVLAGMPSNTFSAYLGDLEKNKLERLISMTLIRQFIRKNSITVPDKVVNADIEDMRQNPPSAGCMCCRYKSLQQYMEVNVYTMRELRAEVSNNEGLEIYLSKQWEKKYPTEASRSLLLQNEKDRLQKSYTRLWHIFFNTFQNTNNDENIMTKKHMEADVAAERLRNGEKFEALAGLVSNDAMSRDKGGFLGCISIDTFGPDHRG